MRRDLLARLHARRLTRHLRVVRWVVELDGPLLVPQGQQRVERMLHVVDPAPVAQLTQILDMGLAPSTTRFELGPEGTWTRVHRDESGEPLEDVQELMWEYRTKQRRKARRR